MEVCAEAYLDILPRSTKVSRHGLVDFSAQVPEPGGAPDDVQGVQAPGLAVEVLVESAHEEQPRGLLGDVDHALDDAVELVQHCLGVWGELVAVGHEGERGEEDPLGLLVGLLSGAWLLLSLLFSDLARLTMCLSRHTVAWMSAVLPSKM